MTVYTHARGDHVEGATVCGRHPCAVPLPSLYDNTAFFFVLSGWRKDTSTSTLIVSVCFRWTFFDFLAPTHRCHNSCAHFAFSRIEGG